MIVIKGNLIIRQVRNSNNSEDKFGIVTIPKTSSEQRNKDIIAFADLDGIDISDAMVITGDVECDYTHLNGEVLVTGQVTEEGGNYAS